MHLLVFQNLSLPIKICTNRRCVVMPQQKVDPNLPKGSFMEICTSPVFNPMKWIDEVGEPNAALAQKSATKAILTTPVSGRIGTFSTCIWIRKSFCVLQGLKYVT